MLVTHVCQWGCGEGNLIIMRLLANIKIPKDSHVATRGKLGLTRLENLQLCKCLSSSGLQVWNVRAGRNS